MRKIKMEESLYCTAWGIDIGRLRGISKVEIVGEKDVNRLSTAGKLVTHQNIWDSVIRPEPTSLKSLYYTKPNSYGIYLVHISSIDG